MRIDVILDPNHSPQAAIAMLGEHLALALS